MNEAIVDSTSCQNQWLAVFKMERSFLSLFIFLFYQSNFVGGLNSAAIAAWNDEMQLPQTSSVERVADLFESQLRDWQNYFRPNLFWCGVGNRAPSRNVVR